MGSDHTGGNFTRTSLILITMSDEDIGLKFPSCKTPCMATVAMELIFELRVGVGVWMSFNYEYSIPNTSEDIHNCSTSF